MNRIAGILCVLCAVALLAGCAAKTDVLTPKIDAAKKAVDDAKAAGAMKLCPDEFASAEMKLQQTQLLAVDQTDQAAKAADQTVALADFAKKCAMAHSTPVAAAVTEQAGGPPDELKNFKTSIYFDFSSNSIKPAEREKLDKALAYLNAMYANHKFYVVLTAYTDPPGTEDENMALAQRRALVTRFYLTTNGFPAAHVFMQALDGHPAGFVASATPKDKNAPPPAAAAVSAAPVASTGKKDPERRRVDLTVVFERPAKLTSEVGTTE
jgi:outer membrane protein OmpA-like peptidoglycan-associated protein